MLLFWKYLPFGELKPACVYCLGQHKPPPCSDGGSPDSPPSPLGGVVRIKENIIFNSVY